MPHRNGIFIIPNERNVYSSQESDIYKVEYKNMTSKNPQNNAVEENIRQIVETRGWHVALFEATDYQPSFGYTIGLWKNYRHPELICFGLSSEALHSILNIGGELVKANSALKPNTESDVFFNSPASILQVHPENIPDYLGYAIWFNKGDFPVLQIVWQDKDGAFPWQEGFSEELLHYQPLLDRNMHFKFREPESLAVFTSRNHLENGKPILYVLHDAEGDWQVLTGDDVTTDDAKIICLGDMIKQDPSLNDLFNLDNGEFAKRETIHSKWGRDKVKP